MSNLVNKFCGATPKKLTESEIKNFINEVKTWEFDKNNNLISRDFKFKNYYNTIAFINAAAWIIHQENHHPEIIITYNSCRISFNTHSVNGISKNDFICAAKINNLLSDYT
jgi:4a-hydroxytetrahydrobiopterin dehydratase